MYFLPIKILTVEMRHYETSSSSMQSPIQINIFLLLSSEETLTRKSKLQSFKMIFRIQQPTVVFQIKEYE